MSNLKYQHEKAVHALRDLELAASKNRTSFNSNNFHAEDKMKLAASTKRVSEITRHLDNIGLHYLTKK